MTNPLETQMRKSLLRSLIQREIFCPLSGDLLDVRTAVVVLDADGDPYSVFSPAGFRQMTSTGVDPDKMLIEGFTWDKATFPK